VPVSASGADARTGVMMEQWMCTAPLMRGGVASGSGGVRDGLLLRKKRLPA
jgi:hypothetical protein